jgi:hypothetical protein
MRSKDQGRWRAVFIVGLYWIQRSGRVYPTLKCLVNAEFYMLTASALGEFQLHVRQGGSVFDLNHEICGPT